MKKTVLVIVALAGADDDTPDPIGQSPQFYRGLRRDGVESDLVP